MQNTAPYTTTAPDAYASGERLRYLDLAKGIGVILVIMGHCWDETATPLAAAIHIPLFFIVSGLFFRNYDTLKSSILKKINALLVPFIFFLCVGDTILYLFDKAKLIETLTLYPIISYPTGEGLINFSLWYLITLFCTYILFLAITNSIRSVSFQTIAVIILGAIGCKIFRYGLHEPFFIHQSLVALPFIWIGYLANRYLAFIHTYDKNKIIFLIACVLAAVALTIFKISGSPCIYFFHHCIIGHSIAAYAVSFLCPISVIMFCKTIDYIPIISQIGRYSIIPYGIHIPIKMIVDSAQLKIMGYCYGPLNFLLVLLITLAFTPIILRLFPKLTAQKPLITMPAIHKPSTES